MVILEIKMRQETFYGASSYMEYNDAIENSFKKIERVLEFTKGVKIIMAIDRNSRSTTWHDVITNVRGRLLEEFVESNHLHIINEESPRTTFHSSKGQSNIDITITDNKILAAIENWEISEEECASDHNIITFHIKIEKDGEKITNPPVFMFIVKEQQRSAFHEKIYSTISKEFQIERRREGHEGIDDEPSRRSKGELDIRQFTAKLEDAIQTTCREMYRFKEKSKSKTKGRSVHWWIDELQVMRERTNALRRRYHRTTTNETLRESRKKQYNKA